MELKLDNSQSEPNENPSSDDFSMQKKDVSTSINDDDGYYHAPVTPMTPLPAEPPKKQVHIPVFVFILLAFVFIAIILKFIPFNQKTKLDEIARMPQESIEEELGLTLTENPDFVTRLSIPNNEPDGFVTYTNKKEDFSVIYYNGKQYGISFSSPNYTLFGVKIGDSESHILSAADSEQTIFYEDGSPAYEYSTYFNMIEDMSRGGSTADYFLGKDGSVLVLVINDTSSRVVNIIYYYDSERVMKDVSPI